jgi:hypothetical protein
MKRRVEFVLIVGFFVVALASLVISMFGNAQRHEAEPSGLDEQIERFSGTAEELERKILDELTDLGPDRVMPVLIENDFIEFRCKEHFKCLRRDEKAKPFSTMVVVKLAPLENGDWKVSSVTATFTGP